MRSRMLMLAALPLTAAACGGSSHTSTTPTAAIVVQSPKAGASMKSPIHMSGTANTFEGVFTVELKAGGSILAQKDVTATSGSGVRGTYAVDVPFSVTAQTPAELVAYEASAKNGEPTHMVSVPIRLLP